MAGPDDRRTGSGAVTAETQVTEVLTEAQGLGFLGPGPVTAHITHAEGFVVAAGREPGYVVDLGSGGGVPGLILAMAWPRATFVLLDSSERRTVALARAVGRLGLEDRVVVVRARAEDVGRDPAWRGRSDLVVARGFGPPAVTAECAAPLLPVGGLVVVSEPPPGEPGRARWDPAGLAKLGLRSLRQVDLPTARFRVLEQDEVCPDRYPRRAAALAKRPLF